MILHFVIAFLLCCQQNEAKELENISVESILDQVAIPTKIINQFLQKPTSSVNSKNINLNDNTKKSPIHYENSNGFVPMVASTKPYQIEDKRRNFTKQIGDINSKTYSRNKNIFENNGTEIRSFSNYPNSRENRRLFHMNDNQDEFELLKVSNGTPAVANYESFYNHSKGAIKSDHTNFNTNLKKPLRLKNRSRNKQIHTYLDNLNTHGNEDKRNVNNQQKSQTSFVPESTTNYLSQKATLPMTNAGSLITPKIKVHTSNSDNKDEVSFKRPIMVEPSNYKVDMRLKGQDAQLTVSTSDNFGDEKEHIDSENVSSGQFAEGSETNRNYESSNARDFSDENLDYTDEIEKPHQIQKTSRKRPSYFDSSRKLPKEHRETYDSFYDDQGRKHPNARSKSRHRQKTKQVQILNEYTQYDNEDDNSNDSNNQQNGNESNTWNQVAPNVEISHSNGFEINQIEKPKLHVVPINIISSFDHATALDNSQGFDITNAMFTGFIPEGSIVSTAAPLVSSSSNYDNQNLISSSTVRPQLGISSSVPDIIVGQASINNPVQSVLTPNKLQQNLFKHYMQSTVAPALYAVTPRPGYSVSSTIEPNFQQLLNQIPLNQQTRQSNGYQGQNMYQYQNTQSTTSKPYYENDDSQYQSKKKLKGNNGQFVASASLSVDQGIHRHSNRDNHSKSRRNNYNKNNDDYSDNHNQQTVKPSLNAFIQPTIVPAILHTGIGLINNQNQQLSQNPLLMINPYENSQTSKASKQSLKSMKQSQYSMPNNRYQLVGIVGIDSMGGATNNINAISNLLNPLQKAQLPILGAKNVEIINPNLNANAYAISQIPAAIVTTPIPIFTTTGFLATKQALSSTTQEPLSASRQFFNPINFVPNYDLVKSQSILNHNIVSNDQFSPQNLNLIPIVAGGNFYKHSQGGQNDGGSKSKYNPDLEKYAEEMFKESLRTIYNSHKWNNDPRFPSNVSLVDKSELAKLRNELLRIKTNLGHTLGSKDVLEAHYTENKVRTAKPGSEFKRPDSSIERPYRNEHKGHHHSNHHRNKPKLSDFLTPPRVNSFVSLSPFHDAPVKKRPRHGPRNNFNHEKHRLRPKQGVSSHSTKGSEAQASAIVDYRYPIRSYQEKTHYSQPDYQNSYYPTFTTASPDTDLLKSSAEYKSSEKGYFDINHQRTHNLMGLLMKNKQLPMGMHGIYFTDKDAIGELFNEENRRTQLKHHTEPIRSFKKKHDTHDRPVLLKRIPSNVYSNSS